MKAFPIHNVISAATGYYVGGEDGIGGTYDVLNHMTGDNLYTHQLPRAAEEARPSLEQQHPWLGDLRAKFEAADATDTVSAVIEAEIPRLISEHGTHISLTALDAADHTAIDPLAELAMKAPHLKVITVKGVTE